MAVTSTQLTVDTTAVAGTPATSFATPSITPSADKLILAAIAVYDAGSAAASPTSVTGNGLTWVKVIERDLLGLHLVVTSLWRAMGAAPTAGPVTANFGFTAESCPISVSEHGGVDLTGTNGSGAIRQAVSAEAASSTAALVTLAAFGHVDNAAFGAFSIGGLAALTAGSGFAIVGDAFEFAQNLRVQTEFKASNDTTVDGTYNTAGNWTGLAVELVGYQAPATKSFPPVGARRPRPNLRSNR